MNNINFCISPLINNDETAVTNNINIKREKRENENY